MSEFHIVQSSWIRRHVSAGHSLTECCDMGTQRKAFCPAINLRTQALIIKDLRCHLPNNRYVSGYSLTELEFRLGFILVLEVNSFILQRLMLTAVVVMYLSH